MMTPKFHVVFEEALGEGISRGLARFYKHRDDQCPEGMNDALHDAIVSSFYEWFDFPKGYCDE
jgi:hypothetical protein